MSSTRKQRSSARNISASGDGDSYVESFMDESRHQRQHEKDTLQRLNTRLADYIEKVRRLEVENEQLLVNIKDIEITERKEKGDLHARFEQEIRRLRNDLEKCQGDKTKLEVERDKAVAAADDLRKKAERFENEWKVAANNERRNQSLLDDLQSKYSRMNKDYGLNEKALRDSEAENGQLKKQVATLQKSLEDESVIRASLQSKLDAAMEDLRFQTGNLKSQLDEEHKKRQVEMTTVSRRLETEYEDRLGKILEESRKRSAAEIAKNSEKLVSAYKSKLDEAINEAKLYGDREKEARMRMRQIELSSSGLETTVTELEKKLGEMERRLAGEQALRRSLLDGKDADIADRDSRISDLNAEIARLMASYNELADAKVLLDNELRDYETLLNQEESRLNISTKSPRVTTQTITRIESSSRSGVKRRRISDAEAGSVAITHIRRKLENTSSGPMKIVADTDAEGQYLTLENTGEEDLKIGGWILKCRAGGREVQYKFHSRSSIPAGQVFKVWSSNTGKHPSPDYTMKSQVWPTGGNPEVSLVNDEDEEVASLHLVEASNGDSDSVDPNERCSIM